MHAVGQQDNERVVVRVDPERRPGVTRVAEGFFLLKALAARAGGVARVDVEAVAAAVFRLGVLRVGEAAGFGHFRDGRFRQDAYAVEFALVEDHAAEACDVAGGAEQARVSGDAAEGVGARVVDLAGDPLAFALFRRRDSFTPSLRRV